MKGLKRWPVRQLWDARTRKLISDTHESGSAVAMTGDFNAIMDLNNNTQIHPELRATAEGVPSTSMRESISFQKLAQDTGATVGIPAEYTFYPDRSTLKSGMGFTLDYTLAKGFDGLKIEVWQTGRFDHLPITSWLETPVPTVDATEQPESGPDPTDAAGAESK